MSACDLTAPSPFLGRWLPVWIFLAISLGVALGRFAPEVLQAISDLAVGSTALPIAAVAVWLRRRWWPDATSTSTTLAQTTCS